MAEKISSTTDVLVSPEDTPTSADKICSTMEVIVLPEDTPKSASPSIDEPTISIAPNCFQNLDPAQYPRLAPGGVCFQITSEPQWKPSRKPERLLRTKHLPLKHTPSEKKVLAHYLREDMLEDRRIQAQRNFRYQEAARRRREARMGADQPSLTDKDRTTPTIARRVRNVKAIAAEVKVRVIAAEAKGKVTE